ncbi:MAG TPA: hypothetical protein VFS19_02840 [Planctomycetota bacterium]|nr:hypothetical protein [Planctomycetota bacterium]
MGRFAAALLAALIFLPAAAVQDDEKDLKKQEQQKADDEAKAVLKTYTEKKKKARTQDEFTEAIEILKEAKPHKLIRTELISILDSKLPAKVRIDAAAALKEYRKDTTACEALFRHAKDERAKDNDVFDLRKRCLRSFGDIAPFGKSMDLQILYNEPDTSIARAAIEATEVIKSVRMLRPLLALLAELERIRDDDGRDPGPEVPGGGGPNQGQDDKNSKRKRKADLEKTTLAAINSIWGKIDSKKTFKNYTEANGTYQEKRSEVKKFQDEEDAKDAKDAKEQKP